MPPQFRAHTKCACTFQVRLHKFAPDNKKAHQKLVRQVYAISEEQPCVFRTNG
jgi:hypothetical protein